MPDENEFKLKDYERIIDDIIDEYFDQHNINYDYKDLFKSGILGESVPEGSHRMPNGEIMLDSEMEGLNAITPNTNI